MNDVSYFVRESLRRFLTADARRNAEITPCTLSPRSSRLCGLRVACPAVAAVLRRKISGLAFARLVPAALVAMAALFSGCSKPDQPGAAPASEKAAEAQSRVKRGANGEVILTL